MADVWSSMEGWLNLLSDKIKEMDDATPESENSKLLSDLTVIGTYSCVMIAG